MPPVVGSCCARSRLRRVGSPWWTAPRHHGAGDAERLLLGQRFRHEVEGVDRDATRPTWLRIRNRRTAHAGWHDCVTHQNTPRRSSARRLSRGRRRVRRAIDSVETDPAAALTAACAILEALFKIIINDDGLQMPSRESVGPLWTVVRKHLDFDPGSKDDDDVRKILQGLASVVDGIGALRTHSGSAHGRDGRKAYRIQARHGRLAVHAAHTLALFVIETWKQRKVASSPVAR